MASSLAGQAIVAFVSAVLDQWNAPSEPIVQPAPTSPKLEGWNLSYLWSSLFTSFSSTSASPVVVLGESSSAFLCLLDLAHKLSPEVVITLFFFGIVFSLTVVLYLLVCICKLIFCLLRRVCRASPPPPTSSYENLSETARQVFDYVRLQNPDLFVNMTGVPSPRGPIPVPAPRAARN